MLPTACPKCNRSFIGADGYRSGAVVRDRLLCLPCADGATSIPPVAEVVQKVRRRRAK